MFQKLQFGRALNIYDTGVVTINLVKGHTNHFGCKHLSEIIHQHCRKGLLETVAIASLQRVIVGLQTKHSVVIGDPDNQLSAAGVGKCCNGFQDSLLDIFLRFSGFQTDP